MTTYRDRHLAGLHTDPNADTERTVDELKAGLKALDQPVGGTKAELEKRLAKAQKAAAPPATTTSEDVSGLTG